MNESSGISAEEPEDARVGRVTAGSVETLRRKLRFFALGVRPPVAAPSMPTTCLPTGSAVADPTRQDPRGRSHPR